MTCRSSRKTVNLMEPTFPLSPRDIFNPKSIVVHDCLSSHLTFRRIGPFLAAKAAVVLMSRRFIASSFIYMQLTRRHTLFGDLNLAVAKHADGAFAVKQQSRMMSHIGASCCISRVFWNAGVLSLTFCSFTCQFQPRPHS